MGQCASKRKALQLQVEAELLRCARYGDVDRVRELFAENPRLSVECVDGRGRTPLISTASSTWGNIRVARFLLDKGANVDAVDKGGRSALTFAVTENDIIMAQLLLGHGASANRHFGPLLGRNETYSPLGYAISWSTAAMVALLLQNGAITEETLFQGKTYTALYVACWRKNAAIVRLLLDHNDGVDMVNAIVPRSGDDPAMSSLCKACQRKDFEMAQLLVQHGAQVIFHGGVYPDSPSPLVHAVESHSLELVQLLLESISRPLPAMGGDNNSTHRHHPLSPPLTSAIHWDKIAMAQLLLSHGANVNDRPFLWQCAKLGRPKIARLFMRGGANVNLADDESGETPLWAAAQKGRVGLVKELLKAEADVNVRDDQGGETPLWVAYRHGHKKVVYLLLRTSPQVWPRLANVL